MKRPLFSLTLSFLAAPFLCAQEAAPAKTSPVAGDQRLELMPAPAAPTGQLAPEPLPLIPEPPVTAPKHNGGPAIAQPVPGKKSKTEIAADEMQERIHYRQAKTKALEDPAFLAEWDQAHHTRTDYARRAALKAYYLKLFARMAKLDPSIKTRINVEQERCLHRLLQTRVAATVAPEDDDIDDRPMLR